MTRIKKTRKQGVGSSRPRKSDAEKLQEQKEKRIRKKNGNAPGTRQAVAKTKSNATENTAKDPRLGSKKPIDLGASVRTKAPKPKAKPVADIAKVRPVTVVDDTESLMQALAAIESDALLQDILEKQENEQALSEAEITHYNNLMERHQEISEQLGLSDDEEEQVAPSDHKLSEDDLWQKFNDFGDE